MDVTFWRASMKANIVYGGAVGSRTVGVHFFDRLGFSVVGIYVLEDDLPRIGSMMRIGSVAWNLQAPHGR